MLNLSGAMSAADIDIPLPAALCDADSKTLARISGPIDAPLVVLLGGISANRFVADGPGWWPGMVGTGAPVDPARHRILGIDFAADESGAFAPSTFDQAEVVANAIREAGRDKADCIIGASYGGMTSLALAARWPELAGCVIAISAPAVPHPSATAIRELQRRAVALGIAGGRGEEGLAIARGLAMLTYRTAEEFAQRFEGGIDAPDPLATSAPGAYLRARGEAYRAVMSPGRFLSLSASIDRHRVEAGAIHAPCLIIGATSDQLVPPAQLEELAAAIPASRLHLLDSLYGHDMFLKDADRIAPLVRAFLEEIA